jgi:quercetin dioxygenase-like cupin family protein
VIGEILGDKFSAGPLQRSKIALGIAPVREVDISYSTNPKTMKKIALILTLPLALSLAAVAAQKKDASKKSTESATSEQHVVLDPANLEWGDAPPGLPAGAKLAVLAGDPNKKGLFAVRLQTPTGYKVPPHTHPTAEHITIISGTFNIGTGDKFDEATGKELRAGGYMVMPAGMKHYAWTPAETIIQIDGMGPFVIKYVNPEDDPRNAKKQ